MERVKFSFRQSEKLGKFPKNMLLLHTKKIPSQTGYFKVLKKLQYVIRVLGYQFRDA